MTDKLRAATNATSPNWLASRGTRKEYWLIGIPILVVGSILSALIAPLAPGMDKFAQLAFGIGFLLFMIRRLHDLGLSGWLAPLINVGFTVLLFATRIFLPQGFAALAALVLMMAVLTALGAWPGTPDRNAFGPPPGKRRSSVAEVFS